MAKEITTEQIEMLEEMVARARKAAAIIETYDQDRVDHLCQAVAAALYDLKVWAQLSDEDREKIYAHLQALSSEPAASPAPHQ